MIVVGVGYRCDWSGCDATSGASLDDLTAAGWCIAPPLRVGEPWDSPRDWCPEHVPPF